MDNKDKNKGQKNQNVLEIAARCPVCKGKAHKAGFCAEHFQWFKMGLVNRKGEKPKDFDKKFQAMQRRKAA
ncbi:MAG: hypothetical protein HOO06_06735 [Bdellovibrionaceae bacterium]|nr:hypothetical protein [Pseudobdellovibrionaceae bacterium]